MTFLCVLVYLVAGFGAYWLVTQENNHIQRKIESKYGEKATDVYADYFRKTQWIPESYSVGMLAFLCIVVSSVAWSLWPIVAIGGGIYEWFVYKHVDKVWSEKLRIELK